MILLVLSGFMNPVLYNLGFNIYSFYVLFEVNVSNEYVYREIQKILFEYYLPVWDPIHLETFEMYLTLLKIYTKKRLKFMYWLNGPLYFYSFTYSYV